MEPPETAPTVKAGLAVAVSETVCGEAGASSDIVKLAACWPAAVGLKTSEIVQLAAGATAAAQLLVNPNSEAFGPPRETEEMCSVALPELLTVSVCDALEVPCVVTGKDGEGGEKVTVGTTAMPLPLKARLCGEPEALSETIRLAVRWPAAAGVKTTEIVQLEAGATAVVQLLVKLKSEGLEPLMETEETVRGAFPELMMVNTSGVLGVPWFVEGNVSAVGEKVTAGAAAVPVPVRERNCGVPGALSAI